MRGADTPLKIFVIGCGRSGTNWLGEILSTHPDIAAHIEQEPAYSWVRRMAIDPLHIQVLMPSLLAYYRDAHERVLPKHFADKSHSNLWIAEHLADHFPEARFIGIRRAVAPTVASMLKHPGVLSSIFDWDRAQRLCRYLNVTDIEAYCALTLEERCAKRVVGSAAEIVRLQQALPNRVHVVNYEALHINPRAVLSSLANFLGVADDFGGPMPRSDSLEKWRSELSDEQQQRIAAIERAR
jgi:hypothetical protein